MCLFSVLILNKVAETLYSIFPQFSIHIPSTQSVNFTVKWQFKYIFIRSVNQSIRPSFNKHATFHRGVKELLPYCAVWTFIWFGLYSWNCVKLRCQLPERASFYWILFILSFFMYIFNSIMLALHKSQHMQQAILWHKCGCD